MKKKSILLLLFICALLLVIFIFVKIKSEDHAIKYNDVPKGKVILTQQTYSYPRKTIMVLYEDGRVLSSTIIDELLVSGDLPDENYKEIKKLEQSEIEKIIEQINVIKSNKVSEYSKNDYGISIKTDKDLKNLRNYSQEEIDKLYKLLKELI